MDISIITPTCNRCESLIHLLKDLGEQQKCDNLQWEVIVVDNYSTDRTKTAVEEIILNAPILIRYAFEPHRGTANARNRGLAVAQGQILAFTDDDCRPEPTWVAKISQVFQDNPQVDGLIGGCRYENGKPFYEDETKNKSLLRGNGLNMAFRKTVFDDCGFFDFNLGPGSIGCSGEETEFIFRALQNGKQIIIHEDILVTHQNRSEKEDVLRIKYRDYKGHTVFLLKHILYHLNQRALKELFWMIKGIIANLFGKKISKEQRILEWTKMKGILVGFALAGYIWLLRNPILRLWKKSAL